MLQREAVLPQSVAVRGARLVPEGFAGAAHASLGLRAYSMTPGGHAALQAGGSPHSACRVCTLPAKACLTGTTWSSSQVPAVSPQPHRAHLPPCPAKVFCLSAALGTSRFALSSFRKISCASPASRWPRYSCPSACSSGSSRILVPQPAVLRRAADGHLGALANGRKLAPRLAQVLAPEQASAASKRLHSPMGGRVCLASPL